MERCFTVWFPAQLQTVQNDSVHSEVISIEIKVDFLNCVVFLKVKFVFLPCHFLSVSIINEKKRICANYKVLGLFL